MSFLISRKVREREEERETLMRAKHPSAASCTALAWDWACNSGMCPDLEMNWRPGALDNTQPLSTPARAGHCYVVQISVRTLSIRAESHIFLWSQPFIRVLMRFRNMAGGLAEEQALEKTKTIALWGCWHLIVRGAGGCFREGDLSPQDSKHLTLLT